MSRHRHLILLFLSVICLQWIHAQAPVLHFKTGDRKFQSFTPASLDSFYRYGSIYKGRSYGIMQFLAIPGEHERKLLSASGITLLEYLPDNSYAVVISQPVSTALMEAVHAHALVPFPAADKMDPMLAQGSLPSWAVNARGTVDVLVKVVKGFEVNEAASVLGDNHWSLLPTPLRAQGVLLIRTAPSRLLQLASLPFIAYVQPSPPADHPLNGSSRATSRASVLNAPVGSGGRGLNGEGVTVGVGDNADVQSHIDFAGRLINRSVAPNSLHGVHTTGTTAGAGLINERYRGYAAASTVISQYFSGILTNASVYVQDHGMVLTNNSYGNVVECSYHGTYDIYAQLLDEQAFQWPSLLHVFAAGNSGGTTCAPFPLGYATVLGGYQCAKNVITVGATNDSGARANFSSRGPVKDGRLKPEIAAMGQSVISTYPNNGYGSNNGTSMAAPGVTGGLALLYQRYRQLHGTDPQSALMKALLFNGATDLGTVGPDYSYGYGGMNLLRSVDMLEKGRYFSGTIAHAGTRTHTINVPAGTAQLRVMLYWHDPAAALPAAKTLVNDIDLQVKGTVNFLPKKLDSAAASVGTAATEAPDHWNNSEQVIIANPPAGNYDLNVLGTLVPQGPQGYFIAYDLLFDSITVTNPGTGESLVPGETVKIQWDAWGSGTDTYDIAFSADNGGSWTNIATGLAAARRLFSWIVPATFTDKGLIRVQRSSGAAGLSRPFVILGATNISLAATQCESYCNITWTPVAGASDYELLQLSGAAFKTIGFTNATSFVFANLSRDTQYLFSVRPRINGSNGRRAIGLLYTPSSGNCMGSFSDGDLKLAELVAPRTGRKYSASQLTVQPVTIRIRNLDDAPVNGFRVFYSVNGGPFVSELSPLTVPGNASLLYTFSTPFDFSATGNYSITAVVQNLQPDPLPANDTLVALVRQLPNDPVDLASAFSDDFEAALPLTYTRDTIGLFGATRYDFSRSGNFGRLRTFVNSGMAHSGQRAATLDIDRYNTAGSSSYLTGTYNLSAYNAATKSLRLDFYYLYHGIEAHATNRVWIRGSETKPWIEAYDLDSAAEDAGMYYRSASIDLSRILIQNGQDFSSTFGIRWGKFATQQAAEKEAGGGCTVDDIRLYIAENDIQVLKLESPSASGCAFTNAMAVQVSVRNSSPVTQTAIPIRYRINNGAWVNETIASIAPNTTISYVFNAKADLSTPGSYLIEIVTAAVADNFRTNDTLRVNVMHAPLVQTFPYLEDFENSNGYWYTGGKRSSWQYGTPSSPVIKSAASGQKAWKTGIAGNYHDKELSYLYSPCFNTAAMSQPTLSFSAAMDIEDCGNTLCDGAWIEYSADGIVWNKLNAATGVTNGYNKSADALWSIQDDTRWHVVTMPLPGGINGLRIRFVMASDEGVTREGLAIDDIHIYDNVAGIYEGPAFPVTAVQPATANSRTDLLKSGKLLASVQHGTTAPGSIAGTVYLDTSSARWNNGQYYHPRNLVLHPAGGSFTDSVTVRFYFTDAEMKWMLKNTGCSVCTLPASAYELGVSIYSDADTSFENGSVLDDQQGSWQFIPSPGVRIVPFDKGYYASFKTARAGEYWLSNGGLDRSTPLPIKLLEFTAKRTGRDALLNWSTGSETNVFSYEVQVARSVEDLQALSFSTIGMVASQGNSTTTRHYSFTDTEPDKWGTRFYRLRIINSDGSIRLSDTRPVRFDDVLQWRVYPNPSAGLFNLFLEAGLDVPVKLRVLNAAGQTVWMQDRKGTGTMQKVEVDLTGKYMPTGVYLLRVQAGDELRSYRLYKQ